MLRDGKTSRRMLSVFGPRPHVRLASQNTCCSSVLPWTPPSIASQVALLRVITKRGPRQQTLHYWGQFRSSPHLIEWGGRDSSPKPPSSSSSPEVQRLERVSVPSLCPPNSPQSFIHFPPPSFLFPSPPPDLLVALAVCLLFPSPPCSQITSSRVSR